MNICTVSTLGVEPLRKRFFLGGGGGESALGKSQSRICKPKEPQESIPCLAELIPRKRFLGSLNDYKYGL